MGVPINVDDDEEVKGDMTPMIDIIFLLLVFFILTTKFVAPERVISSLLPTDKGQAAASPPVVEPPEDINICIYPSSMSRGLQPSQYDAAWYANIAQNCAQVTMRIGNLSQITVVGAELKTSDDQKSQQTVLEIHSYIGQELAKVETAGERNKQPAVVIHCFSGLPWMYALVAYDGVRAYEGGKTGLKGLLTVEELKSAREVDFAPPRIRNFHTWQLGYELYEIIHMK